MGFGVQGVEFRSAGSGARTFNNRRASLNPKPETRNPKPETLNPKPKPETLTAGGKFDAVAGFEEPKGKRVS